MMMILSKIIIDDDGTDDVNGNAVSVVPVSEGTQTLEG